MYRQIWSQFTNTESLWMWKLRLTLSFICLSLSLSLSLAVFFQVFTPEVMEAFLARTVVPKLAYCLQSLVINPQDEHIGLSSSSSVILPYQSLIVQFIPFSLSLSLSLSGPVKWVLSWTQLIPIHHFVEMFTKYFFPKWLQVSVKHTYM